MADRAQSSNMSGVADKGKGKAVDTHEDVSMGEDESEEDDSGDEYDERQEEAEAEEDDEDNMEEIDLDNIVEGGRRTRGKKIDFAKAAEQTETVPAEEEDEEDDDYEAPADEMEH